MSDSNPYRLDHDASPPEPGSAYPPAESRGPGCLFWGCLGVVGLFFLVVVGCIGGSYYWAKSIVANWTSDQPTALSQVTYTDEDVDSLTDQIHAFRKAQERGESFEEVAFTADDLNALITDAQWFTNIDAPAYVIIEGDQISAEISIPMEEVVPIGMFSGRYLNASATATVELVDGDLVVMIQAIEVNGKTPPKSIMDEIMGEDVFKDNEQEPRAREFIEDLETAEIEDGRIILKLKPGRSPQGTDESSEEPEAAETESEIEAEVDPEAETALEEAN